MSDHDLLSAARSLTDRMAASTGDLVRVESPSSDVAACDAMVDVAAGVAGEWTGSAGAVFEHRGRRVLRWGPQHPRVLLLGHLDTVWPIGTLHRLPWLDVDGRLRGPGVFDMKAGVVQGLTALHLLGVGPDDGVAMLLTTDEEIGSGTSRDLIEATARGAEAVLVLEPSVAGDLKSARKGTSWYVVEIRGRAAHAGLEPEKGINALAEAASLVRASLGWGAPDVGTTVTPTTARAGTTDNTVPDRAVVGIDARAWSAAEQQRVDDLVRGWRPEHPEATVAIIDGGINRPAMPVESAEPLLLLADACAADLGLPPIGHRSVGGGSDGNFTAALGVPTLDGLGAVGDGAHADHEWVDRASMADRAALCAAIIRRVLKPGVPR